MANVTCRSCGRRYDYSQHDCCPDCGAYNRPPRHEQVDADGTVRHLTDADYAKRKSTALGKVCFEEKECHEEKVCYEDEARASSLRKNKLRQAGKLLVQSLVALVIVIGLLGRRIERRPGSLIAGDPLALLAVLVISMTVINVLLAFIWAFTREPLGEKMRKAEPIVRIIIFVMLMIVFVQCLLVV